ncbi:GAF domain-containing protein [Nostoc sp. PCC 7524]|uniref:GAF domain-containing protein n=1 Tax=Nostoc sp. (strain ATCC 29411 / PCC 7524) TaxID=28072 RepID=UPI00029F24F5|nr:GAF domain-containing protein [Nostoc sp. PCC 7524]AFY49350.1 GAF domain-containing protein [Nostoc sp. PCC 7524]
MLINHQMGQPQPPIAAEQHIVALGNVLQRLREADDVEVLIETTISYIKQQFNYSLIWIAFYDRLEHTLLGKGGVTPGNDASILRKRVVLNPGDLLEQVVIQQRPVGLADIHNEPRIGEWQEFGKKHHIQGTIIFPIRYKDRCLGLLLVAAERWGYLIPEDAKARLLIVLGELGAILYQHEILLLQKQTKRPDEPLLELLENLRNLNNLEERLKAAIQATHEFVAPSRTNVYWFERQGRYFWCRMSNQLVKMGRDSQREQPAAGMTVQELNDFYYALSVNQIVWIGDARSSLKSHFTAKLLQRWRVRSLLAAPIIWQQDLLGFLAVEGNEPRIWTEADKNFVQGAAGLLSLVAPTEKMESTIQQIQEDSQLTSQVAQAIYSHQDLKETLRICAAKVLTRLAASRFLVLQYDPDRNNYQVVYQTQPHNRRPLTFAFSLLTETDRQMLKTAKTTVEVENLEEDLRFFNWRPPLIENGVRSLLVCNCAQGHRPDAILLITHTNHRTWTTLEKELLWIVSQQIGVILRQWRLLTNSEQQQQILQGIQQCLCILEEAHSENSETEKYYLETTALRQIASILGCPMAFMLSWSSAQAHAEIIPGVITDSRFSIVTHAQISVQHEALIQWALAKDGFLNLKVDDLPAETKKWLNCAVIGKVLVIALRTAAIHQPTAVMVLVDQAERYWPQQTVNALETLIEQLAWLRRQQQVSESLESTTEELQQLNWYKHRRLEEIHRTTTQLLNQINDLGIPTNELTQTRYQLLWRQLGHTTTAMTALIKQEQWQLHKNCESMPIASLLKRSLERIDNLLQQQKLWIGVHGLGQSTPESETNHTSALVKGMVSQNHPSPMAIAGDIVKFELVLHELLLAACHRSPTGSRIDIWCRRLDEQFLEVSITDNGTIESQLLTKLQLQPKTRKDILAVDQFEKPPHLHLLICQQIIQQLAGELHFYQLPDHRVVSRLLLPLAVS